jgi:cytochrome c biogenesis protein CcdA
MTLLVLAYLGGVLTILSPCILPVLPLRGRGAGAEAAADMQGVGSPETYIGYDRAQNFDNAGGIVPDRSNITPIHVRSR